MLNKSNLNFQFFKVMQHAQADNNNYGILILDDQIYIFQLL